MLRKSRPEKKISSTLLPILEDRNSTSRDRRKTSRKHLGRLDYLQDSNDVEESEPEGPVSQYDFFKAASCGKIKMVSKYLDDDGNVNAEDGCKRTALHRASLYEHVQILQALLSHGAEVNTSDKLGNTALHWACRGTNLEVVETLMSYGANVHQKDNLKNSPLHVATRVGFVDCVSYLIECGAKLDERDSEGDTPIHDAVRLGRPKVVRALIIHGADLYLRNTNGKTAVDMVQTWYNNTKEALAKAELERNRKGINKSQLAAEMENVPFENNDPEPKQQIEMSGFSSPDNRQKSEQTSAVISQASDEPEQISVSERIEPEAGQQQNFIDQISQENESSEQTQENEFVKEIPMEDDVTEEFAPSARILRKRMSIDLTQKGEEVLSRMQEAVTPIDDQETSSPKKEKKVIMFQKSKTATK